MKNVAIIALGEARRAVELRWVREVVRVGHVTPVPGSPSLVHGVVNVHGAIVPLLALPGLPAAAPPRAGDSSVLLEVDGARLAIRVDLVVAVCSLEATEAGSDVVTPDGDLIPLLVPQRLVREALAATRNVARTAP